jgi:hypothetical protein
MRDPRQASGADKVIVQIASPIQYAAATLARGLSNLWGEYIYLVDVKEDNTSLPHRTPASRSASASSRPSRRRTAASGACST